jgi:hypothetical protein
VISQSGAKQKKLILFSRRQKKPFATKEKGQKKNLNSRLQKNSSTRKPKHRDPKPGNPKKLATAYDEKQKL